MSIVRRPVRMRGARLPAKATVSADLFKLKPEPEREHSIQARAYKLLVQCCPADAVIFSVDAASDADAVIGVMRKLMPWARIPDILPQARAIVGRRKKERGIYAGIPDTFVLWRTIWAPLEGKTRTGRLTDDQKIMHRRFAANGCPVSVYRTPEEAVDIVAARGIPLRARISA